MRIHGDFPSRAFSGDALDIAVFAYDIIRGVAEFGGRADLLGLLICICSVISLDVARPDMGPGFHIAGPVDVEMTEVVVKHSLFFVFEERPQHAARNGVAIFFRDGFYLFDVGDGFH